MYAKLVQGLLVPITKIYKSYTPRSSLVVREQMSQKNLWKTSTLETLDVQYH